MMHSDVVVIGGGFAGLTAALAAAKRGQIVTVLAYGMGTLPLNTGLIDVLGYGKDHTPVEHPLAAIAELPEEHPYKKIGVQTLKDAVAFFCGVARKNHIPYHGSLDRQMMVPTAVGTLKPTCLAPHSLAGSEVLPGKRDIIVVSIQGLKDFYGDLMLENLKKSLGSGRAYRMVRIDTGLTGGRDISTRDVARWMDTSAGMASLTEQLRPCQATSETLFIVPQVLGTKGHACYQTIASRLGTDVLETTCMPPSVNGMRLRAVLVDSLRALGVDLIENTKAIGAIRDGKHVDAVLARTSSNERTYYADKFILATGGFYGGGLTMRDFEQPREMVFGLPVSFVPGEENWTNPELFSKKPQGFAKTGIRTDGLLRPVDAEGAVVLENVHIAGRNLAGYDFCFEHSGNGVALASAYRAAMV